MKSLLILLIIILIKEIKAKTDRDNIKQMMKLYMKTNQKIDRIDME